MAACASSHRADAIGVDAESIRIGSEVAHGCFDVFHRRRKLMARREPIADGSRNVSPFRQLDRHRQVALPCASAESSTVDEDDSGTLLRRCGSRTNDIHRNTLADVRVFEIRLVNDCRRHRGRSLGENGPRAA